MSSVLTGAVLLATQGPDPDNVTAGWVGFGVFLALAVAVTLLWLSFRKQLKKIDFEEEPDEPAASKDSEDSEDSEGSQEAREQRES